MGEYKAPSQAKLEKYWKLRRQGTSINTSLQQSQCGATLGMRPHEPPSRYNYRGGTPYFLLSTIWHSGSFKLHNRLVSPLSPPATYPTQEYHTCCCVAAARTLRTTLTLYWHASRRHRRQQQRVAAARGGDGSATHDVYLGTAAAEEKPRRPTALRKGGDRQRMARRTARRSTSSGSRTSPSTQSCAACIQTTQSTAFCFRGWRRTMSEAAEQQTAEQRLAAGLGAAINVDTGAIAREAAAYLSVVAGRNLEAVVTRALAPLRGDIAAVRGDQLALRAKVEGFAAQLDNLSDEFARCHRILRASACSWRA
eukprot:TRINITY_DN62_c0_g1_i3.p1 TRINITY_DN62_c0_g1~~TRINITY_DN62_c0_g1_i3.p1  ORF type:complete len:310 (-),score=39.28 TRINITY_DN62_c0_g1_i3:778-1707(-)